MQIPHPDKSPLDINYVTLTLLTMTAIPLLVWFAAAIIFVAGLGVLYFPIPLITLALIPLVFQYLPIYLLEKVEGWLDRAKLAESAALDGLGSSQDGAEGAEEAKAEEKSTKQAHRRGSVGLAQFGGTTSAGAQDEEPETTTIPQQLILKVVASQVFCTAAALAALGATYQGDARGGYPSAFTSTSDVYTLPYT